MSNITPNIPNIYTKLGNIQAKISNIVKSESNKYQHYKYFTEYQALKMIRPLLTEQELTLTFSDNIEHYHSEKLEKEWMVRYLKQAIFTNQKNIQEQLTFNFWAMGQNTDIAKAKGSAETYAIKYFLSKFFLIPITDNLDPDLR